MFLVFYPADSDTYERHSFDGYNWNEVESAKIVFEKIYREFGNNDLCRWYNITSKECKSPDLNMLVDDINNEEIQSKCWPIYLNLEESDVLAIIHNVSDERLEFCGDGTEYFIVDENYEIATYPNDDQFIAYINEQDCKDDMDESDSCYVYFKGFPAETAEDGMFLGVLFDGKTKKTLGTFYYKPETFQTCLQEMIDLNRTYFKNQYPDK